MKHVVALVCGVVLCSASLAWGQAAGTATGGSVWGRVIDQTGGVLPGVTVIVTGPTLMGARETVSNAQGIYRFPSLPPGQFTVTFALAGFRTLVREGIRLTLSFTATVDVQLEVSAVAESVEVSGVSPVVDAVNTRAQTSFTKEMLESVPLSRDMWSILGASPSVEMARVDVGSSTAGAQTDYRAYGQLLQNRPIVEGVVAIDTEGGTSYFDYGAFAEVNIGAAAQGAEMGNPGTQSVFISKSGGNAFHGDFYLDHSSRGLTGRNIDADQKALGVGADSNIVERYNDLNVNGGGYILRDRLWWFGSYRYRRNVVRLPNFTADEYPTIMPFYTGKLTAQLPGGNQIVLFGMVDIKKLPYRQRSLLLGSNVLFNDANATWRGYNPGWLGKLEWNRVFSNHLFIEARVGHWADDWHQYGYGKNPYYEDLTTRVVSGSQNDWYRYYSRPQATGALSYFKDGWAGSHTFKLGWELMKDSGLEKWPTEAYANDVVHVLRSGVPAEVYQIFSPIKRENYLWWTGVYLSDTWTRNRVTFNLGARFDRYRFFYPDQQRPENPWAAAMNVEGVDPLLIWNVLGPRAGVAWDVTGNQKNLFKASYGRYYHNKSRTIPMAVNPNDAPQWRRYFWNDLNGDKLYQLGEEGKLLGTRGGLASGRLDTNLKAPITDEATLFFEREVRGDLGVRAGFVMRRTNRLIQTMNELNPYDAFNIPATVVDPGPDGVARTSDDGTLQLYNLDPTLIGRTSNLVISPADYVVNARTIEFAATRRLKGRWSMNASFAVTWRNDFNGYQSNPNQAPQSEMLPVKMFKLSATYDAGWGVRVSPLVRYQSGTPFGRTASITLNYGSQTVQTEPTGTRKTDDALVFDVRCERGFTVARGTRLSLFADIYNLSNSNAATAVTTASGSAFLRPTAILAPRMLRIGAKFSF